MGRFVFAAVAALSIIFSTFAVQPVTAQGFIACDLYLEPPLPAPKNPTCGTTAAPFTPAGWASAYSASTTICKYHPLNPFFNQEITFPPFADVNNPNIGNPYYSSVNEFYVTALAVGAPLWYNGVYVLLCGVVFEPASAVLEPNPATSLTASLNSNGTVTLSWTNPTTYTDGSSLTIGNINLFDFSNGQRTPLGTITSGNSYTTVMPVPVGNHAFVVEVEDATAAASFAVSSPFVVAPPSGSMVAYAPTLTTGTGSFGSASVIGHYLAVNKLVFLDVTVTISSNSSAGTVVEVSLPVPANSSAVYHLSGREDAVAGAGLQGFTVGSTLYIMTDANGYPGGNGYVLSLSGWYQSQ